MSQFIGSKISLISNSNIRYVGTLVEINSENSTVALENVMSYGTENRVVGEGSFPASKSLYEYILFRGKDVKDLRIETDKKEAPSQPEVPNDPAILGSARPRKSSSPNQQPQPQPQQQPHPQQQQQPNFNQPQFHGPGSSFQLGFGNVFPPNQYGNNGFPQHPPPPFPGYGNPTFPGSGNPQWDQFPPNGQNFPPNAFPPQPPPQNKPIEKDNDAKTPEPTKTRPPPTQSELNVAEPAAGQASKGRVAPAVPKSKSSSRPPRTTKPETSASAIVATSAVAAAMAKVNGGKSNVGASVPQPATTEPTFRATSVSTENLSQKLSDLSTGDQKVTTSTTTAIFTHTSRGKRGRGFPRGGYRGITVPDADFDFAEANAKFTKEDAVKEEASNEPNVSSPGSPIAAAEEEVVVIVPIYDKKSSFFDNISSEIKERNEAASGLPVGGAGGRGQERQKNIETFGQGSVDNFRGGYRGRGRGGRGGRGPRGGNFNRGRGYRPRGGAAPEWA